MCVVFRRCGGASRCAAARGSAISYTRACGCSSTPCSPARGHALLCALPLLVTPRLRAPLFLVATVPPALVPVGLRRRVCLSSLALLRPLCHYALRAWLPCAPLLLIAARLCVLSCDVTMLPLALLLPRLNCRLCMSARVLRALSATARGRFPRVAPPIRLATPLRVPSSERPVMPPARLPVGPQRRVHLGPWSLLRSLCDCLWALCCLSLSCSVTSFLVAVLPLAPTTRGAPLLPMLVAQAQR